MIRVITESESLNWIDVENPTPEELDQITVAHGLSQHLVQDCLDPEHLAKIEDTGDGLFIILRAFDAACADDAASVRELTRKIAIFLRGHTLITIHRAEHNFLKTLAATTAEKKAPHHLKVLLAISKATALTYDKALEHATKELEFIDDSLHARVTTAKAMIRLHGIRRRLSTIKRLLWQMSAVFQRLPIEDRVAKPVFQDLKENSESLLFYADELLEETTSLLNLELSLASQRNNDTIRVLTLFSVFFMPLTFIVGVYGMNFQYMPELQMPYGYAGVWILMISLTTAIWVWFRYRKWL